MGQVDPLLIEPPPILRDAYVHDVIDLETYERFVDYYLAGEGVMLPTAVTEWAQQLPQRVTDEPGSVIFYRPIPVEPRDAAGTT